MMRAATIRMTAFKNMLTHKEVILKKFFIKKTRKYATTIARKKTLVSRKRIV